MKNQIALAFIFVAVICFNHSCALTEADSSVESKESVRRQGQVTRGSAELYSVTTEDIEAYIRFKALVSKDENLVVKSVVPFPEEENPLLYAINYEDRWELISTDKRTAAVVATGEGEFNPDFNTNKSIAWLSCLADEIRVLKESHAEPKNSESYQLFWMLVTTSKALFGEKEQITRSGPDTMYHPVPGHYELFYVEDHEETVASINHLVHTEWGQGYPYNLYCPIDSSVYYYYSQPGNPYEGEIPKCVAGCVAVAGGQMVYYMYSQVGNDGAEPYRYASCATREWPNTNYDAMQQWDQSFSNWIYFNGTDSSRMAAVMLANIGKNCLMEYYGRHYYNYNGSPISSSSLDRLQPVLLNVYQTESYLFDFFNANFNLYDYIEDLLIEGYPSIVDAGNGDTLTNRHAFIVDRYKKSRTRYDCYYRFCPDNPNLYPPYMFEEVLYSYYSPVITYFGMNWGDYGNDDGTWCVKSGDWYFGNLNYDSRVYLMTFDTQGGSPDPGLEGQSVGSSIN